MNIFDKGYPYKIKLLGYSLQNKEQEYIKANMYILTHGKIYTVSFISPIFGEHTLIISEGYDEIELFHAHFFGVCNEHLSMTHVNVTPEELLRNNIPNAHVIMKTIEQECI